MQEIQIKLLNQYFKLPRCTFFSPEYRYYTLINSCAAKSGIRIDCVHYKIYNRNQVFCLLFHLWADYNEVIK